jgi:hypothetical protein
VKEFLQWLISTDNILAQAAGVILCVVIGLSWLVLVAMLLFLGHTLLAAVSLFGGPVCVIYVVYLYEQW